MSRSIPQPGRAMRGARRAGLAAVLALCLVSGCSSKKVTSLGQPDVWDANGIQDFTLTEMNGREVSKADLLGKPSLCVFVFSNCVTACPRVMVQMRDLQEEFPDPGLRMVAFSVDPDRDTPDALKEFASRYSADPERWWFLTGNKGTIYRLIHESFMTLAAEMVFPQTPDSLPTPGNADVLHSAYIMYVDERGKVQGKFNAVNAEEMAELRKVLRTPPIVRQFPAVNATLNATSAVLLVWGWLLIRFGRARGHKLSMLAAFGVSIVFLGCYLVYHFYAGSKKFEGDGVWKTAYLAMLISHIVLAAAVPVLAGLTMRQAFVAEQSGNWPRHRRLGKITLPIWLYVSVTGVIIYVVLYHGSAIQESYTAVRAYFEPPAVAEPEEE